MRMVKFLGGLAVFIAVCVLSFNYVEGHSSTAKKEMIDNQRSELNRISEKLGGVVDSLGKVKTDKLNVEERLKQACGLLTAAEIENEVCEKPQSEDEKIEEGKDSDG